MNKLIYGLSRSMAWFGSLVLVGIALMSVASIVGRALSGFGLGPVPGDFELVEAGTALAVFCFLPWCHLKGGHAVVDLLWNVYPRPMRRVLLALADALRPAQASVVVIEGVGHNTLGDSPEYLRAVGSFLGAHAHDPDG